VGTVGVSSSTSVSPTTTATYTLTATNAAGQQSTAAATVTVSSGPAPSVSSFGWVETYNKVGWDNEFETYAGNAGYGVGFTATCSSWTLLAPNGHSWSGGALSSGSYMTPTSGVWLCEDGEYQPNNWAWYSCAVGSWKLTLTMNSQTVITYWVFVASNLSYAPPDNWPSTTNFSDGYRDQPLDGVFYFDTTGKATSSPAPSPF
jgi:hypothetical protein